MYTLTDWKNSSQGWPVTFTQNNTDGLTTTEYVIYDGTNGKVTKATTLGGTASDWGTLDPQPNPMPTPPPTSVTGQTTSSLYFKITCPSGTLEGELSDTPLPALLIHQESSQGDEEVGSHTVSDAHLAGHHHERGRRGEPIPCGSWTASEG